MLVCVRERGEVKHDRSNSVAALYMRCPVDYLIHSDFAVILFLSFCDVI